MGMNNTKISALQSNALSIAVFQTTILVVFRHSFTLHQYYKGGNPWMDPIDFNVSFQLFMARFTNVAIPFFFLISGFLFFNNIIQINNCLTKIRKRISTLLIPYLLWNILLLLLCLALSAIPALKAQIKHTYGLEYSLPWIVAKLTYRPIVGQFWYIRTLFIFILFSPLYLYAFKSKAFSFLALIVSIVIWQLIDTDIVSTEGACFFLLGGNLTYHGSLPKQIPCRHWLWLLVPQFIILYIILFTSFQYAFVQKACIFIQLYVGWQICLYLASKTKVCHFLMELNHHSFFLYATHVTILKFLSLSFSRTLPHAPSFSFLTYLLCFSLTVALSLTLSFFSRSLFPQLYSIFTGGRGSSLEITQHSSHCIQRKFPSHCLNKESAPRLFLIDVWIIVALIFVIIGHCSVSFAPSWYDILKQWIYSFHMGAFFFISGFLMHYTRKPLETPADYFRLIGDKFRKFAVPFVLLGMLLSLIPLMQHHFSTKALRTALNLFYRPTASYVIFLWFIYVLFEFYLITPVISRFYNPAIVLFLLIAIGLSLFHVSNNLFAIHLFSRHFIFLILGIIAAENIDILRRLPHLPLYLLACAFLYLSIFHPGIFYPASGVLALPFMLSLSWICAPLLRTFRKTVELISKNCFGIYLYQMIAIQILARLFTFLPNPSRLFPLFLILAIPIAIGFSLAVIKVLNLLSTSIFHRAVH